VPCKQSFREMPGSLRRCVGTDDHFEGAGGRSWAGERGSGAILTMLRCRHLACRVENGGLEVSVALGWYLGHAWAN
jgi:hypothetical protein